MLSRNTSKPSASNENCTVHILSSARKPDPSPSPNPSCSLGRCLVLPLPKPFLQPRGVPGAPQTLPAAQGCLTLLLPMPGRRHPAAWLPLHTLGHVLMKQSYVSALIAMMVKSWQGGGDTDMVGDTSQASLTLPAHRCGASATTAG